MGAGVFHGRVRDGIGWIIPRHGHQVIQSSLWEGLRGCDGLVLLWCVEEWMTAVHVCCHVMWRWNEPIGRLGPVSCTHCCASTPGLLT